ncbi:hypothetical protein Rhal01_02504 [Rubritalea halochordaticola]|uniref:Uncharacterized protein n=1 Tax=Rubritalea halochordaticola TaxID=714537 RepID=A0ABP9V0V2_9BACT
MYICPPPKGAVRALLCTVVLSTCSYGAVMNLTPINDTTTNNLGGVDKLNKP